MKESLPTEDTRYAFAIGKIRVLESRLFHPSFFYQLVDAPDIEEVLSLLRATPYRRITEGEDLIQALDEEYYSTLKELHSLSPEPSLLTPFFLLLEMDNLKILLRSLLTLSPPEEFKEVLIPLPTLRKALEEKNTKILPSPFSEWLEESLKEWERKKSLFFAESYLEKKLYQEIINTAFSPFLALYFKREADFYNIKLSLRARKENLSEDELLSLLILPSMLPSHLFLLLFSEGLDPFLQKLSFTPYELLSREGLLHYKEKEEFWKAEKNWRKIRLDFLEITRYSPFYAETLLDYLIKKENEILNLRTALLGKLSGMEKEKVKERLGPFHG